MRISPRLLLGVLFLPLMVASCGEDKADDSAEVTGKPTIAYGASCPEKEPRGRLESMIIDAILSENKISAALLDKMMTPELVGPYQDKLRKQREWDWAGLCKYREENRQRIASGVKTDMVFIGSSGTELWRRAHPDLFGGGLVNRGISGQTSPQALVRFYPDVVELKPRIVHLFVGGNDIAGNTGLSSEQGLINNIKAMVDIAKANNISVMIGSYLPVRQLQWSPEVAVAPITKRLNGLLRELCRENGLDYIDYYSVMVNDSEGFIEGLSNDGVHPTRKGYDVMFAVLKPYLDKYQVEYQHN